MDSQEEIDALNLDRYLAAIRLKARGGDGSCLCPAECMTITLYSFALEVTNGGIEQFFLNPAGDRWRDTLFALKVLGPARLTAMFEEALSVFPRSMPSENQLTRSREYLESGAPAQRLLQGLTDEYYDLQSQSADHCLYATLGRFATKQIAATRAE
jgi:hypothetical protein